MKQTQLIALALAAPLLAVAGAPDPASPEAPVPRLQYRSVFQDTPRGVEAEATDWKKANAEVGQFPRGHADILKWEAQQGAAKPPAGAPANPAASPARAPAVAPATPAARPASAPAAGHRHP